MGTSDRRAIVTEFGKDDRGGLGKPTQLLADLGGHLSVSVDAVIVSRLNLPKFDIELILSRKTAKLMRLKPAERASVEPTHWLPQWRVELATDGFGRALFLITNAVTVYSFLIPRTRKLTFDDLAQQFLMRLRFTLLAAQPPIDWQPGEVRAVRGGNASLIGTMNNMVYLLSAPKSPLLHKSDEQLLNSTPFFAIPEHFPYKAFFGRLNQKCR